MSDPTYAPGTWFAVVTPRVVVLLEDSVSPSRLQSVWETCNGDPSLDEMIEVVTGGRFVGAPFFGIGLADGAGLRVVVRSGVTAVVGEVEGAARSIGSGNANTWVEEILEEAQSLRLFRDAASSSALTLPVTGGIVCADSISWSMGDGAQAGPASHISLTSHVGSAGHIGSAGHSSSAAEPAVTPSRIPPAARTAPAPAYSSPLFQARTPVTTSSGVETPAAAFPLPSVTRDRSGLDTPAAFRMPPQDQTSASGSGPDAASGLAPGSGSAPGSPSGSPTGPVPSAVRAPSAFQPPPPFQTSPPFPSPPPFQEPPFQEAASESASAFPPRPATVPLPTASVEPATAEPVWSTDLEPSQEAKPNLRAQESERATGFPTLEPERSYSLEPPRSNGFPSLEPERSSYALEPRRGNGFPTLEPERSSSSLPPADPGDHDGLTMHGVPRWDPLGDSPRPDPPRLEPATGPMVAAVRCLYDHPNPPQNELCRICATAIPDQGPTTVARPDLGFLHFSTGQVVPLNRPVIIGRAPSVDRVQQDDIPRPVKIDNLGQDISRNHVEVRLEGWDVLAVDLNSANGTVVTIPGRRPQRLVPRDPFLLVLGATVALSEDISFNYGVSG